MNDVPAPPDTRVGGWIGLLRDKAGGVALTALVSFVAGVTATVSTELQEIVAGLIFPEKVEIEAYPQGEAVAGTALPVMFNVTPTTRAGVSDSQLRFDSGESRNVDLKMGSATSLAFSGSSYGGQVPGQLLVVPRDPGQMRLQVRLTRSDGEVTGTVEKVLPVKPRRNIPHKENFGGRYRMTIGPIQGSLVLKQPCDADDPPNVKTICGNYAFDNGSQQGTVGGMRTSDGVVISFFRAQLPVQFYIEGGARLDGDNYIEEIRGAAQLVQIAESGAKTVLDTSPFTAVPVSSRP